MGNPSLSMVPVEVVLLTMSHVDSPQDLFALIRTSRYMKQCFDYDRERILQAVAQNMFPGGLLTDAIAACKASALYKHLSTKEGTLLYQRNFVAEYAQARFKNPTKVPKVPNEVAFSSLSSLWDLTEHFVGLFCIEALEDIRRNKREDLGGCPLYSASKIEPSHEERLRIRRALIRFEIFRRVFIGSMWVGARVPDDLLDIEAARVTVDLSEGFLLLFSCQERVELFAITQFLTRHCLREADKMLDQISTNLCSVIDDLGVKCFLDQSTHRGNCYSRRRLTSLYECLQRARVIPLNGYEGITEIIVARGLPFIRWLSTLPLKDRLFIAHGQEQWRTRLSLEWMISDMQCDINPSVRGDECVCCLPSPSVGLSWKYGYHFENDTDTHGIEIKSHFALRYLRDVFWDVERMSTWNKKKYFRFRMSWQHWFDRGNLSTEFTWNGRNTIPSEEKLSHAGLHKVLRNFSYKRIRQEFKESVEIHNTVWEKDLDCMPYSESTAENTGFEY